MQQFNSDIIAKARLAKSPEEIARLAEANGTPITPERANVLYGRLHPSAAQELADDELDSVSGGGCGGGSNHSMTCRWCGGTVSSYPEGDYCDSCGLAYH